MKTSNFISLLENPNQIQQLETAEIKNILEDFPYFQSARAIYLKGLKNLDSFKYNNDLKLTAAHTKDRTVLFNYITSIDFDSKPNNIHQQISEKITEEEKTISNEILEVKENLKIGKPLSFSTTESHSFNQWLQLSVKKPINRTIEKEEKSKIIKKGDLIDSFIQSNPKIEPLVKDKKITASVTQNKQDSSLMTETLAKVYLEQKKYENAIQAYRILSLKYPEKSGFFADQIKRIQILQKNKS